jgi:riboflavin biosynthesis pyrimidine reductase
MRRASTWRPGVVDELRLHVAPVILGAGERLFEGVHDVTLEKLAVRDTGLVTHLRYRVVR